MGEVENVGGTGVESALKSIGTVKVGRGPGTQAKEAEVCAGM